MKLLLLLLAGSLLLNHVKAQNTSWFYGTWNGETYFPNGPVTKRIIIKLQVTKVSGNNFTAKLENFYPNDTTVRLERELAGNIAKKNLVVTSSEQTYIRDPRTQNFWYDCTGCATQSSFTINSSKVEIKVTTINCGDVCNGETMFSRDTSDLDSTQKIELAKWFGLLSNKAVAKKDKKKADSSAIAIKKPVAAPVKNDSLIVKSKIKKDTLISIKKTTKKDTIQLAAINLKQEKNDSITKPAVPDNDTIPTALTTRTTNLINTFQVTSPHIVIQLYDNAEIDGDMVSVYHNGKLIVDHQTLTHKAITLTIDATAKDAHHEFIMIAENLGLTPPNTALMRITAGGQKFELEVSSDFDNNSKISIDYTGE